MRWTQKRSISGLESISSHRDCGPCDISPFPMSPSSRSPYLQLIAFHPHRHMIDTFPLTVKDINLHGRRLADRPSIFSRLQSTNSNNPLAPSASQVGPRSGSHRCWEGILLYIQLTWVAFRTRAFFLSPFALLSTPSYFTLDLLSSSVAASPPPPFSTHTPSCTSLPFSKSS